MKETGIVVNQDFIDIYYRTLLLNKLAV